MTLRESATRIGGFTGYELQSATPATVSCEATLSSAIAADITILKGTQIRTSDAAGIPFEVTQDYTIAAGDVTPKTLIVTFSPSLTGAKVINSFVLVTSGSANVDCIDTTINLSQFIQSGQSFNKLTDSTVYTILSLEQAPGSVSPFSRMVLDRPYEAGTEAVQGEVYDRRIALVQGQSISDQFIAPTGGTAGFSVRLSRSPYIDNSATVTVNNENWTQVKSTAVRDAEDKVYQVKTLPSGETLIIFGDGSYGAAVPSEASIAVNYRIGGGVSGNIALSTINTSITGLTTTLTSPVPVLITNATSTGIGGQESETLEQARINIPAYTQTNDRAVTLSDYQTIAQRSSDAQFGSVAFARSTVRTENAFLEGNIVVIYAWTLGTSGGLVPLSPQLKLALQNYMQTKAVGTDLVEIFDGTSRPVPISLRFKVFGGFGISSTKQLVTDTIKAYVNALRPGDPILYSNLMSLLDGVYGVDTVNMATPITDLFPANTTELFSVPQDTFVYSSGAAGRGQSAGGCQRGQCEPLHRAVARLPDGHVVIPAFPRHQRTDHHAGRGRGFRPAAGGELEQRPQRHLLVAGQLAHRSGYALAQGCSGRLDHAACDGSGLFVGARGQRLRRLHRGQHSDQATGDTGGAPGLQRRLVRWRLHLCDRGGQHFGLDCERGGRGGAGVRR